MSTRRVRPKRLKRIRLHGATWPMLPPLASVDLQELQEWWVAEPPSAAELSIGNASRMYANRRRG